jgi:hypothetical protein
MTRRFFAGFFALSAGNMWVVGGFVTIKEEAVIPMFVIGLFLSVVGAWLVMKSRAGQG